MLSPLGSRRRLGLASARDAENSFNNLKSIGFYESRWRGAVRSTLSARSMSNPAPSNSSLRGSSGGKRSPNRKSMGGFRGRRPAGGPPPPRPCPPRCPTGRPRGHAGGPRGAWSSASLREPSLGGVEGGRRAWLVVTRAVPTRERRAHLAIIENRQRAWELNRRHHRQRTSESCHIPN